MGKIKGEFSLSRKLVMYIGASLLISAVLFSVLQYAAHGFIRSYCSNPAVIAKHIKKKAQDVQQYVTANQISLTNLSALDPWTEQEGLTALAVYYNGNLLYSSHMMLPDANTPPHPYQKYDRLSPWEYCNTIIFHDGTAQVFINDLFMHRYIDYATNLSLVAFFICSSSIVLVFIRKKVRYIHTLEQEIKILQGGDLSYDITIKGNDELASLAFEINEMRKAFVEREQYAGRVKAETYELMTSLSHDLRTPLTAIIGYLEVLDGDKNIRKNAFLLKIKNRSLQLKELIDHLFEYFFISTNNGEQFPIHTISVKEALGEIIHEYIYLLKQNGFSIFHEIHLPLGQMKANDGMLQRIFDNLLSNIRKYADPIDEIRIKIGESNGELSIVIENTVIAASNFDKTSLGLANCKKMMALHQGRLHYEQKGDQFMVKLFFPLI